MIKYLECVEEVHDSFHKLKDKHFTLKIYFASLEKSFRITLIELDRAKKNHENLEDKKSKIGNYLSKKLA